MANKFVVGQWIRIDEMYDEPNYNGLDGIIEHIDGIGQLHGSWGSLAIIPEVDKLTVLKDVLENTLSQLLETMSMFGATVRNYENYIVIDAANESTINFKKLCEILKRSHKIEVDETERSIMIHE